MPGASSRGSTRWRTEPLSPHRLELGDIADLRAYERERPQYRSRIIELKKIRRVAIGPIVTVIFENRDTVRFQIQEMARAERIVDDAKIQEELDVYNPLVPGPGECCLTLFVELTSEEQLREWLPKLVGVERAVVMRIGDPAAGDGRVEVRAEVEPQHEKQLTRETVTASVHYVHLRLGSEEVARFAAEPVSIGIDHPAYDHETPLPEPTKESVLADWSV